MGQVVMGHQLGSQTDCAPAGTCTRGDWCISVGQVVMGHQLGSQTDRAPAGTCTRGTLTHNYKTDKLTTENYLFLINKIILLNE